MFLREQQVLTSLTSHSFKLCNKSQKSVQPFVDQSIVWISRFEYSFGQICHNLMFFFFFKYRRNFPVARPWKVEIPRSLGEVVVNWNLPMHQWLKICESRTLTYMSFLYQYITCMELLSSSVCVNEGWMSPFHTCIFTEQHVQVLRFCDITTLFMFPIYVSFLICKYYLMMQVISCLIILISLFANINYYFQELNTFRGTVAGLVYSVWLLLVYICYTYSWAWWWQFVLNQLHRRVLVHPWRVNAKTLCILWNC